MNHEIHEVYKKEKALVGILAEMGRRENSRYYPKVARNIMRQYRLRIEMARRWEAAPIERLVRDAIIDYQEMFAHAPNDDAERDLIDRAERGNAWLVANGYEPEKLSWSKEVSPCL